MADFNDWCVEDEKKINGHDLVLLTADDDGVNIGLDAVTAVVPDHYVFPDRYAHVLERLKKPGAAKFLKTKLPTSKKARSGDLGEILAISYIQEQTNWDQTAMKLRWKDHREMAMRGDDLLAIGFQPENQIQFLKGESKSRSNLATAPVADARVALNSNDGRPTPHALSFLADRLYEEGREELADQIDKAQYEDGIAIENLCHMVFTFSGNNPDSFLSADLNAYDGDIEQFSVGLRITPHQEFIKAVFEKVIADGDT